MRSKNKSVYESAEYSGVAGSYNLVLVRNKILHNALYVKQTKSYLTTDVTRTCFQWSIAGIFLDLVELS